MSWLQEHVFVALWVSPFATLGSVLLAIFLPRILDWTRRPRLSLQYAASEPFVRSTMLLGEAATWQRLRVKNVGKQPAQRCIGMLIRVTTDGKPRDDIDPVQLRWAGVPRRLGFDGIDLAGGEFAFLDVLVLFPHEQFARIQTFEEEDFNPGFAVDLTFDGLRRHHMSITVTSDSANPATIEIAAIDSAFLASG